MVFDDLWVLIFLPFIIILAFFWKRQSGKGAALKFSLGELVSPLQPSLKLRFSRCLVFLRVIALTFILLALARPQSPIEETVVTTEGIDIVLAIDVSTSMLAEDFELLGRRQNRLEVVKEVVKEFIEGRESDRIGIVVFAARPYTVCPLTLDYDWLLQNLERVKIGMVEDGTAIGSGISAALNRLKDTQAKGKVVILLTDGRNNAGKISPMTAAEAAKSLDVKIYTIGAGTKGTAPYPFKDVFGNIVYKPVKIDIDDETLTKIAAVTGAKYFRAEDTRSLRKIYNEIDKLEKTPTEEKGYMEYKELFYLFLIPGLALLLLEIFLRNTIFRKIP